MTPAEGYFAWPAPGREAPLPAAAAQFFRENGYAVLTSFCAPQELSALRARAAEIIAAFHAEGAGSGTVFTTREEARATDDARFLASAAEISCFLEEKQVPGVAAAPAVNKIGHALHDLDPTFGAFSRARKVRAVAEGIGLRAPLLTQSMYITKSPRVGGEVRPHRDAAFVHSDAPPDSPAGACLGYWWALEDSTLANGCLWAVPGSHRDGAHFRRMCLDETRAATRFEGDEAAERSYPHESYRALPMNAGDLIVLHGAVVHKSLENTSERSRHAYSIHVVDGKVPRSCWLQRPASLPFREL